MRDDSADIHLRTASAELVRAYRLINEVEEDLERRICHIRLIRDTEALIRTVRRIRNGEGLY